MHQAGQETILFVDDEESILDVASEYFKRRGYQVVTACNGLEAINILENQTVDCCFTDINMPGMDGLALAEHIHKSDNTLPVIIMTGYPSLDNTIQTLKNGVVDFLVKPVNLSQMELCVRRVFGQRRLFVENLLLKKEVESKERLEKLNRELTVKVEEMHILNRILSDFSIISSSSEVFKRLVDMAVEITRSDRACFFIVNDSVRKPFFAAAVCGKPPSGAAEAARERDRLRPRYRRSERPGAAGSIETDPRGCRRRDSPAGFRQQRDPQHSAGFAIADDGAAQDPTNRFRRADGRP